MRNRPCLPCADVLLLSAVCGDSEPPAWTSAAMSAPCQAWRACLQGPRSLGAGGIRLFPYSPGLLRWEKSGQKYHSETQGSTSNLCSPLPLSAHSPSLSGKPSSAHRMWPPGTLQGGTGRGHISSIYFNSRATSSVQAPVTGQW